MQLRDMSLQGTAVAGNLTKTGERAIHGLLYAVEWIDGTFSDGVDAVLSVTRTASGVDKTLLTLTNANDDAWYPVREAEYDNTGAALGAAAYPVISGVPVLTVTSGGTGTGGCILHYIEF